MCAISPTVRFKLFLPIHETLIKNQLTKRPNPCNTLPQTADSTITPDLPSQACWLNRNHRMATLINLNTILKSTTRFSECCSHKILKAKTCIFYVYLICILTTKLGKVSLALCNIAPLNKPVGPTRNVYWEENEFYSPLKLILLQLCLQHI